MARQKVTNRKKSTKTSDNSNLINEENVNKLPFVVDYKTKQTRLSKFNRESFKTYSLSENKEFKSKYAKGTELLYKMLKDNKFNSNNANKLKVKKSSKKVNNDNNTNDDNSNNNDNNKEIEEGPSVKGIYSSQSNNHHQALIKPTGSNAVKKIKLILKPPSSSSALSNNNNNN